MGDYYFNASVKHTCVATYFNTFCENEFKSVHIPLMFPKLIISVKTAFRRFLNFHIIMWEIFFL